MIGLEGSEGSGRSIFPQSLGALVVKMSYVLVRETAWIKEWQTPFGTYIDSKLRWLGVEPSAERFMAAWRAASGPEKFDLEAAFEFYPYELEEDVERILTMVVEEDAGEGGEERAKRMWTKLFKADSKLSPEQERFLSGLGEHLEKSGAAMRLVGENKWFRAYANDAGFHVETKVEWGAALPSDEELQGQIDASLSLAYRRILMTVKENKWLVEPRAGERAIPGQ
jgi:hypothetical protein